MIDQGETREALERIQQDPVRRDEVAPREPAVEQQLRADQELAVVEQVVGTAAGRDAPDHHPQDRRDRAHHQRPSPDRAPLLG